MNRTYTKIKAIGTRLKAWKGLANRSSALKVAEVTATFGVTPQHTFASPVHFIDVGQRGNISFERISSHGFIPSTPEAELPKSEKGDESDS
jgi:hypothetical protein